MPKKPDRTLRYGRAKTGQWYVVRPGKGARFASAPRGKYLSLAGRWRDARNKHRFTSPPRDAVKPRRVARDSDAKAIRRMKTILEHASGMKWSTTTTRSKPRVEGSFGFAREIVLAPEDPEGTLWRDLAEYLDLMRADLRLRKSWNKRGAYWACEFLTEDEVSEFMSLSFAARWVVATAQAANECISLSTRYQDTTISFLLLWLR